MPNVAFAVETRAGRLCSVLIGGHAEIMPSTASLERGFRRKYGSAMRRAGKVPSSFAGMYPQAIRITPARINKYGDLTAPDVVTALIAAS
jgi:hypothetical protein